MGEKSFYPYSIVWQPIPVLTWLFPYIGHLGICTSTGATLDFAGPYTVTFDNMLFGSPTRYLKLYDISDALDCDEDSGMTEAAYNEAVQQAKREFQGRMYTFVSENCHSFVAYALGKLQYKGHSDWSVVYLAAWMFFCSRPCGLTGMAMSFLPPILLAAIGGSFLRMEFLYGWLVANGFVILVLTLPEAVRKLWK